MTRLVVLCIDPRESVDADENYNDGNTVFVRVLAGNVNSIPRTIDALKKEYDLTQTITATHGGCAAIAEVTDALAGRPICGFHVDSELTSQFRGKGVTGRKELEELNPALQAERAALLGLKNVKPVFMPEANLVAKTEGHHVAVVVKPSTLEISKILSAAGIANPGLAYVVQTQYADESAASLEVAVRRGGVKQIMVIGRENEKINEEVRWISELDFVKEKGVKVIPKPINLDAKPKSKSM